MMPSGSGFLVRPVRIPANSRDRHSWHARCAENTAEKCTDNRRRSHAFVRERKGAGSLDSPESEPVCRKP